MAQEWVIDDKYDVMAKIPAGTTRAEFRIMLQHLLTERFKMTVHVQDQLGLRLEAKKGTIEMLAVDRAVKTPVEN